MDLTPHLNSLLLLMHFIAKVCYFPWKKPENKVYFFRWRKVTDVDLQAIAFKINVSQEKNGEMWNSHEYKVWEHLKTRLSKYKRRSNSV